MPGNENYLFAFGCVHTQNLIVTFGGCKEYGGRTDKIFVFDIALGRWRQSPIRCPHKGPYHALVVGDTVHLILLDAKHISVDAPRAPNANAECAHFARDLQSILDAVSLFSVFAMFPNSHCFCFHCFSAI